MKADVYVILDNVQYVRNTSRAWTSRDKIKTPKGEKWLSLQTRKEPIGTKINDIYLLEDNGWKTNNLNLIKENYKMARYFQEIMPYINHLYHKKYDKMIDFNLSSINMMIELLGIEIEQVFASELKPIGKSNELIVDIVSKLGSKKYLSGTGAKEYFVSKPYDQAGIEVIWQEFKHPVYPQLYGKFIPNLSSVDLLFNCGIEDSRKIMRRE